MGYTCKKVAEKVGCSDDTVRKVLKAHDIKIRGGSAKKIDQFDMAGNYIALLGKRRSSSMACR